jgi:hypothetical protein
MINFTPRPLYSLERIMVLIEQGGGYLRKCVGVLWKTIQFVEGFQPRIVQPVAWTRCRVPEPEKLRIFCKAALNLRSSHSDRLIGFINFGAFAKLLKATISFVISIRPHGTTRLILDGF